MTVLGVDVGGTSVRVGVATSDGGRHLRPERPVPRDVAELVTVVGDGWSCEAASLPVREGLTSVVVALPGRTGPAVPEWIPNLPFLDGQPFAAMLADRLGLPSERCRLVNDGQAALVAEAREGAAAGARNAVLVAVGTGIGGAILFDGQIVRGRHGCAGSFGWAGAGGATPDGVNGPWEQVASGSALERLSRHLGGARAVVSAARSADPAAGAVLAEYSARLGQGLAAMASVLDPDVVVIGGGVSAAYDVLAEPVRTAFAQHASPVVRDVPIRAAILGPRAGLLGALTMAAEDGGLQ